MRTSANSLAYGQALLEAMKKEMLSIPKPRQPTKRGPANGDYEDYMRLHEKMAEQNVWAPIMGDRMAVFGGEFQLALLARTIERFIVVLHGPTMANIRNRRQALHTGLQHEPPQHHVHDPRARKLTPRMANTIGVLVVLEDEVDAVVIEHDGHVHYTCLVRPGGPASSLPSHVSRMLGDASR